MKVLIVHAHHEPNSFDKALKDQAIRVLTQAGHMVKVSDLYDLNFNTEKQTKRLKVFQPSDLNQYPQMLEDNKVSEDVESEQERFKWCDFLILQCSLYWFSLPAILKDWMDWIFEVGAVDSSTWGEGSTRKRAMLSLVTGNPGQGDKMDRRQQMVEQLLFQIQHHMLYFVRFEVLPPFIAYEPTTRTQKEKEEYLVEYEQRLLQLEQSSSLPFPKLADYDEKLHLATTKIS